MKKNQVLVSIIVPVFNHAKYIKEGIQSLLSQTYNRREIIVVDDGSTDSSGDIARELGDAVKVFRQKNSGIGAARNLGIKNASGEFLAFMDADDLWVKDKLHKQLVLFDQDPELDMTFGYVQQYLSPEMDEESKKSKFCPTDPMPGYLAGTMVIRRKSFSEVGFFDSSLKIGEFVDWYTRSKDIGLKEGMLKDVVYLRRIHDANQGIRHKESVKEYLHILKSSLDRRRRLAG